MAIKLTPAFTSRLSEKLMDLGNYFIVGLIIGQLATHQFSLDSMILGLVSAVELYLASLIISLKVVVY